MEQAQQVHSESHASDGRTLRDLVLGMADGLTVPFALAAGVTGAVAASKIVVTAGIAEIAAGAVSMGVGGFLASQSEIQRYASEYAREMRETSEIPDAERREVRTILASYGVSEKHLDAITGEIASDRTRWVDFMMRNELGLEKPDESGSMRSAVTVGGGYVLGGICPLAPYLLVADAHVALLWSCLWSSLALLAFGAVRARVVDAPVLVGAAQTWFVGALAAAVAYGLARAITH